MKCIGNRTNTAIIGITELKIDHNRPNLELTLQGIIFSNVIKKEIVMVLLVIQGRVYVIIQEL